MKRYQLMVTAALTVGLMAVTSCGDMNQSFSSTGSPLTAPGKVQPEEWMNPGFSPGAVGRFGLAASTGSRNFHAMHIGQATEAQHKMAAQNAQVVLRSAATRQKLKASNVKYVAVAVKRDKSQTKAAPGRTVMKVNVATGKPTGEVFAAKEQSGMKEGETIKLGGDPTMYFATAGDKL
ncbi:hypothetical protein OVA24_11500 [Luteolibacter sp. SL250]|uniref:hypothetical protein n=1 Tax=Luteolibacter sp. SL250 TaxID=2995170 RepID=UPI00226F2EAB|nr:hypothetical protein [Luteolibacter sp. SL250]WAC17869.1 hypothetical protein OVA24_11500 [Luteolibacter sp. SL250]